MIFGSQNISTYSKSNMMIWMALAFQAGLLDMGGFLSCRSFVSHVTGFATLASLELESGQLSHGLGLIAMLVAFLFGAMTSGVLVDVRLKLNKNPKYYLVFGFLFFITLLVTIGGFNNLFGVYGNPLSDLRGYSLITMLCFTCGVQNGTITLVSKSIVRTTHLTGITTDLGIGLVRVFNRKRLKNIDNEGKANIMRFGILLFFIFGSLAGVHIFHKFEFRGFLFPCLISASLFAITFHFQVLRTTSIQH
jgi:uncharacterized membrane protein YoaK (UPF0700 family)